MSNPSQSQIGTVLKGTQPRITAEMNEKLDYSFTVEAIKIAFTQMCLTKAPGSDGLLIVFFKRIGRQLAMELREPACIS